MSLMPFITLTFRVLLRVFALSLSLFAGLAMAASVRFSNVDLPDLVAGVDLQENRYVFSGALDAGGGLTLIFDASKFASLSVSAYPTDLDVWVAQPDTALGADGLVTLTAQAPYTSGYAAGFDVVFTRLDALPRSQSFELFDSDFNIVATGQALSVPEPATALLFACAALIVMRRLRRTPQPRCDASTSPDPCLSSFPG